MDSRQWVAMREMIPFIVLATLAVLCRFLARRVKNASIGADDYMIVVGLILTYATFADSVVRESTPILAATTLNVTANMNPIRG